MASPHRFFCSAASTPAYSGKLDHFHCSGRFTRPRRTGFAASARERSPAALSTAGSWSVRHTIQRTDSTSWLYAPFIDALRLFSMSLVAQVTLSGPAALRRLLADTVDAPTPPKPNWKSRNSAKRESRYLLFAIAVSGQRCASGPLEAHFPSRRRNARNHFASWQPAQIEWLSGPIDRMRYQDSSGAVWDTLRLTCWFSGPLERVRCNQRFRR